MHQGQHVPPGALLPDLDRDRVAGRLLPQQREHLGEADPVAQLGKVQLDPVLRLDLGDQVQQRQRIGAELVQDAPGSSSSTPSQPRRLAASRSADGSAAAESDVDGA